MANDSIVVMGNTGGSLTSPKSFSKEFRKGFFSKIDPVFTIILIICAVIIFGIFGVLSLKEPSVTVSEQEIVKIQERYARLVLNQPKPQVEQVNKSSDKPHEEVVKKTPQEEEKKEAPQINREKESFVEKQQRKAAGVEERRQKRAQVAQQIQSAGIFAAITASGSGSSMGVSASDLLGGGVSEGIADIGSINISKGTFATKKGESTELTTRKGTRTTDVGIEKQDIGQTAVTKVASVASVNISSKPPEISGESSNLSDRSQATIQRYVNRYAQRLKRIFEDWLKRDPALGGNLTVKFVILPTGAVSTTSIVKSTTNNAEFDETILRHIRSWQFPAVPDGGPVEVVYPFVFEGQS
ncbi:MAG: energy transducer TonB [Fibrobacter sp.]|nr:energy transducer TonB [Fibrobacter sp.]